MNDNNLKDIWLQLKDKIKENWHELTDADLEAVNGDKDKLLDRLQTLYGFSYKKAQLEWMKFYNEFTNSMEAFEEASSTSLNFIGDSIQNFVKTSPVKALSIAAAAGLLLGLGFRL